MTDKTGRTSLSPIQERFVVTWGEMGAKWGINRTVAQIHALLYLSPRPLQAEEIAATLGVARSNVSTSLRELQGWGIVRVAHILGDRREHFESMKDVWEMFRIIVDERKKRETDPVVAMLREATAESKKAGAAPPATRARASRRHPGGEEPRGGRPVPPRAARRHAPVLRVDDDLDGADAAAADAGDRQD